MKPLMIVLSLSLVGCAPLMDAQSNLVTQARRGVDLAQANRASSSTVYAELARVKRLRLDEAFDADAERRGEQGDLSPEWVTAARAAYAVALEAYAKQDAALRASDETARRNLQAVDAALERLQFLQSIQNRWLALPREIKQQKEER